VLSSAADPLPAQAADPLLAQAADPLPAQATGPYWLTLRNKQAQGAGQHCARRRTALHTMPHSTAHDLSVY